MNMRSILALTLTIIGLSMAREASATEDEKPFDPYSCWCSTKFMDVSIGHFDQTGLFVIDVPVWNEGTNDERLPGTTLNIGYSLGREDEPFLIFDSSWYRGQWCFQPVESLDPQAVLLRSSVCERKLVQGGVLPDSCQHYASLAQVVSFSKVALSGEGCRKAADNYLGMGEVSGCLSGSSSIWALLGILGYLVTRRSVWGGSVPMPYR